MRKFWYTEANIFQCFFNLHDCTFDLKVFFYFTENKFIINAAQKIILLLLF